MAISMMKIHFITMYRASVKQSETNHMHSWAVNQNYVISYAFIGSQFKACHIVSILRKAFIGCQLKACHIVSPRHVKWGL